ncbi:MAG: phosphonate C-P lyase system protein PhnL [Desulfopila sp.]|jgi:alpha-D-ribose 1-methylphosphonate 5-triphosphate synthase subunit PhnL|nr:phosphonate C-P lyase system protein PhnL [Desulfopila sp.]
MADTDSTYKLKVDRLTKTFTLHNRGGIEVEGFTGIDFSLQCGQLLALSGPSGVGKSSILKTIYRTYLADSGTILFHRGDGSEVDLAHCPESRVLDLRRREIGFVTQFLKILPRVSALDAVAHPLIEIGTTEEEAQEQARRMLIRLGIREELFNLSPLTFSGGEQQRVNIARGIIAPKELILLDEPTASLDRTSSDVVLELLTELKKRNIAMIAIFHDQRKIDAIADVAVAIRRAQA